MALPNKDFLGTYGVGVALTIAGFVAAYWFIEPAPPRALTMATGSEGGAYYDLGLRYGEYLSRFGIDLTVLETDGSVENLALMRRAGEAADLSFIQGGVADQDTGDLVALGSLFFEPMWVFRAASLEFEKLSDAKGLRIATGAPGSGTRAVAERLLVANGINAGNTSLRQLGLSEGAEALLRNEVDVQFIIAAPESSVVRRLAMAEEVEIMSLSRAPAYARRYSFLSGLEVPEGVLDLEANIPAKPLDLLATTASLVARESLHPALVSLLLQAAEEIHYGGGIIDPAGKFPSPEFIEFPLSEDAARFYDHGSPFLQQYLPFWAAVVVDRLKIMLIPIAGLLYPLFRMMPPVYRWRVRSRVYRWYSELEAVNPTFFGGNLPCSLEQCLEVLDRIEYEATRTEVPPSYAQELFILLSNVDALRRKLTSGTYSPTPASEDLDRSFWKA